MKHYLTVGAACLILIVQGLGGAGAVDMVDADVSAAGGQAYAICDAAGTVCAATAAGVATACAEASGELGWFHASAKACGGFAIAATAAEALVLPQGTARGFSVVEFVAYEEEDDKHHYRCHPDPPQEVCWPPPCIGCSSTSSMPTIIQNLNKPKPVVDESRCADTRSALKAPLLSSVSCGSVASVAQSDGCYTAHAESSAHNTFTAEPLPSNGEGCTPGMLFAFAGQSRRVPFVDLSPHDQDALVDSLEGAVASWWDDTTSTWPVELTAVRDDLRADLLGSIRDKLMRSEVRVG